MSITFDEVMTARRAAEIETAQWLHYNLGSNIVLLNKSLRDRKCQTLLMEEREHLWELKSLSVNSADLSMRHALKQIADNPEVLF